MNIVFPLTQRKLLLSFQGHIDRGRGGANDYAAHYEPFYSPVDGTIFLFEEAAGGLWIEIKDSEGRKWQFAHFSARNVKTGDTVKAGQKIAVTGNSGTLTSGPHSHGQLIQNGQRIDPWPLLRNAPMPDQDPYANMIIYYLDEGPNKGVKAYHKSGTKQKQLITRENSGAAALVFIDRASGAKPLSDQIRPVPKADWDKLEVVPDKTWF